MAKPKKSAKKKSAPKSKPRAKKSAPRLDAAARASMLKPGDSLNELIDDVLNAWALVRKKVRVADVSPAHLATLGKKATRATEKESALAAKQAAKLAPLTDARIIANDAAYRAALKVKRIADAVAETDQDVADAFASVSERFRNQGAPGTPVTTAPGQQT